MPTITLNGVEKAFGAERVLRGVDLAVESGQKLAVVGRNGCGKTTLLRIMAGLEEPDRGSVQRQRGLRLGHMAQEWAVSELEQTAWDALEAVFGELSSLEREMEKVAASMAAAGSEISNLVARYANLQERFERGGGYTRRSSIERVLRGVGFSDADWNKPMRVLSGGERTRVGLAELLLRAPDILLLDEPTNHLDLWAVAWLEEYLRDYRGTVVVVSHDRYFLDRVVAGVYELAGGVAHYYPGDYTRYRILREERQAALDHAMEQREREAERKERLIREAAADERSKRQARSVAKSLARMEPAERWEDTPRMQMRLGAPTRISRAVLQVEGVGKKYSGRTILDRIDFRVEAGERIGIIGANGAGKTTLLRLILGLEQPDTGWIKLAPNVTTEYFAQNATGDAGSGTVFSTIQAAGAGDNYETRSHLAHFLFRGDDVWKNVADLSGGELRRLALARLALNTAGLLLLDEPTNHLDFSSIEAIEDSFTSYAGSVLIVSHDRYFLSRVAHRLLALVDGALHPFNSYEEFAAWHAAAEEKAAANRTREAALRREEQERQRRINKAPLKEEKRRLKILQSLEDSITVKEEEKRGILSEMARPEIAADYLELQRLSTTLAKVELELSSLYERWETIHDGEQ